jgi:hypothetical protein
MAICIAYFGAQRLNVLTEVPRPLRSLEASCDEQELWNVELDSDRLANDASVARA